MLIEKVVLYNIASWKWLHEFTYDNSFTVFSGPTGAWKSFLAVDSILGALYWNFREKIGDIITKWEKEGWTELYFFHNDIDYKVCFWRKRDSVTNKLSDIYKFEQCVNWKWEPIYNKTPEDIIWISYDVAVKTFIISQGDIESFAKADPSVKYKIFASAFNLDSLYRISDAANEQLKSYKQKIEIINWILGNTDLSEIEKKVDYLKSSAFLIKEKESLENTYSELKIKIKSIEDYKNLILAISELEDKNKFYSFKIQNEELVNKEYNDYLIVKDTYDNLKEKKQNFDILTESFKNKKENVQKTLDQLKYQLLTIGNDKIQQKQFFEEKIKMIKDEIMLLQEKLPVNYEFINIEESNIKLKISEIDNEIINSKGMISSNNIKIKDIDDTISKWKEMEENRECPYCSTHLDESICDKIIENNKILKETYLKENKNLIELIWKLELTKGIEQEKLKYIDYNNILLSIDNKNKSYDHENKIYENKILQLEQKEKDILNQKQNLVSSWNQIAWQFIEEFKEIGFNTEIFEESEKIYLEEKYKETAYIEMKQYKVINDRNIQEINIKKEMMAMHQTNWLEEIWALKLQENTLNLKIQSILISLWELNQKIERINSIEKLYNENKDKLFEYTKKIKMLEDIFFLYWKKGKPKQIMESIIPLVEKEANDILEPITDWQYFIKIALDKATQSWELSKNNIFDISINDRGVNRKYGTFSGWEKFQINLALRLAISKVIMGLTGNTFEFVIIDEWFWTQDVEESLEKIINTLESVSHIFKQFIVISHIPQLKERFIDNIVDVSKEGDYSFLYKK